MKRIPVLFVFSLAVIFGQDGWAKSRQAKVDAQVQKDQQELKEAKNLSLKNFSELKAQDKVTGWGFVGGGVLAFGSGFALSLVTSEMLPVLGYGIIQSAGAIAATEGLHLLFLGSPETLELETLETAQKAIEIPVGVKMDEATQKRNRDALLEAMAERWVKRKRSQKRIRGWVRLANAAAYVGSMAISPNRSTSKYVSMGFLAAFALAGGVVDLTTKFSVKDYPGFRYSLAMGPEFNPIDHSVGWGGFASVTVPFSIGR